MQLRKDKIHNNWNGIKIKDMSLYTSSNNKLATMPVLKKSKVFCTYMRQYPNVKGTEHVKERKDFDFK